MPDPIFKGLNFKELIEKEFENVEVFLATFNDGMQDSQSGIFREIMKLLDQLPQREGKFIPTEDLRKLILRFKDKIISEIGKGQFSEDYKSIFKQFDTLEPLRKELSTVFNPELRAKIFKANTSVIKQGFIEQVAATLGSVQSFEINIVNPLTNILYEHAAQGTTIKSAAKRIFDIALSESPGGGILGRYAGQVAHDAIFGYVGSVDKAIGDYIGAKDVNYLGDLVRDSRPQCIRWVSKLGGFIPADKLKSEIAWAKKYGEGYSTHLPTLDVDNFSRVKGGHNCRHRVTYTFGKSEKTKQANKEYEKMSAAFEKEQEKRLTGIHKKRFEENKRILNEKINKFGK